MKIDEKSKLGKIIYGLAVYVRNGTNGFLKWVKVLKCDFHKENEEKWRKVRKRKVRTCVLMIKGYNKGEISCYGWK